MARLQSARPTQLVSSAFGDSTSDRIPLNEECVNRVLRCSWSRKVVEPDYPWDEARETQKLAS